MAGVSLISPGSPTVETVGYGGLFVRLKPLVPAWDFVPSLIHRLTIRNYLPQLTCLVFALPLGEWIVQDGTLAVGIPIRKEIKAIAGLLG